LRATGAAAAAIGRHPREFVAIVMGTIAIFAIFINALFLQKGPHPAPIFATRPFVAAEPAAAAAPAAPRVSMLPRVVQPDAAPPVPVPAPARAQLVTDIQRELTRRGYYDGAADGVWGAKTDAAARDFAQAAGVTMNVEASDGFLRALTASRAKAERAPAPPRNDPIAELLAPSKRTMAVQRALSEFGYGQIKATGTYDTATKAAIEKFERERRLPITGEMSDRVVRELAAMTGRPLE